MPTRPSQLPSHTERTALLKLRAHTELTARELEPTGRQTIQKMMAKGWLERGVKPSRYRMTAAGEAGVTRTVANRPQVAHLRTPTAPAEEGQFVIGRNFSTPRRLLSQR
jgi:hypothetical protein